MIDSTTLASETNVAATSRRCVLASSVNSPTLASQTPAQASQSHNVRKCPVLSGPTDHSGEKNASPDIKTTYDINPSCTDRTLARPAPDRPRPSNVDSPNL